MSFDFRIVGEKEMELYDSAVDSEVQLVFLPGGFDPEVWKHQLRYFSNDYRVISFRTKRNSFSNDLECLKAVFNNLDLDNVILISAWAGNSLSSSLDNFEELILGRIFVGDENRLREYFDGKWYLRSISKKLNHPKIFKKLFFDRNCNYNAAKELEQYLELNSFLNYIDGIERDYFSTDYLQIIGSVDRFSDEFSVSAPSCKVVDSAGSFPFYERPEEFNEITINYLNFLERLRLKYHLSEVERKNTSLKDYEESKNVETSEAKNHLKKKEELGDA